jgi:hypothetical protein
MGTTALPRGAALRFAAHLARHWDCSRIAVLGCVADDALASLRSEFDISEIAWEPAGDAQGAALDPVTLQRTAIVCTGLLEAVEQPEAVLGQLRGWLDSAPVAVITTPQRDQMLASTGQPHAWTLAEFETLLRAQGLRVEFAGLAADGDPDCSKRVALAVLANNRRLPPGPAPDDFRVIAILRTYNEADIIAPAIRYLAGQGVDVYAIDNWSTDGTYELVEGLSSQGVVGVERYPPGGPSQHFEHKRLLERIEALSRTLEADWFIHHDADEIRESPWPGVSLRDALYHVDRCGFNSINHAVLDFFPVDNSFQPGTDFAAHFTYYELGKRPGHFKRINAWKNVGQPISLYPSGGHHVEFKGQRIYPYLFLIKHYPLRTAHQTVIKIRDRQRRARRLARLIGWHHQYDRFDPGDARLFDELCGWARQALEPFDPATFYTCHLVDRLAGNLSVATTPSRWKRYVPGFALQALRTIRRRLARFL